MKGKGDESWVVRLGGIGWPLTMILGAAALWEILVRGLSIPKWLLPALSAVLLRIGQDAAYIGFHAGYTRGVKRAGLELIPDQQTGLTPSTSKALPPWQLPNGAEAGARFGFPVSILCPSVCSGGLSRGCGSQKLKLAFNGISLSIYGSARVQGVASPDFFYLDRILF